MNTNNEKEKKGGFLSSLSGLFGGGSSAAGGASSGFGAAGGLGGLFATKAGIVGMVLGGATIAAGVGVVYNFVGPSSKSVYTPDLFQNSYYEEEAAKAGQARSMARDASGASSSTLDIFREQARKDGLGLASEGGADGGASSEDPSAVDSTADASAEAPSAPGADGSYGAGGSGAPRLKAGAGFGGGAGGGGGSSSSSIPRMQNAGGLSGGIGAQFKPMYRAPAQANAGKTSGMSASAARLKNSPKYAVPNINKKGAFGQAKFASKRGGQASKSGDYTQSHSGATEAFSGETTGSGDVVSPLDGAGLGGAGVSNGASLKGSDPSLNSNESTVPKVPEPEDVDPWQKYENMAMYAMMAGAVLLLITKMFAKKAMANVFNPPMYAAWKTAATYAGYAAIAAGVVTMFAGMMMFSKFGQKMMGGIYLLAGAMLIWQAIEAMSGLDKDPQYTDDKGNKVSADKATNCSIGDKQSVKMGNEWTKPEPAKVQIVDKPATTTVTI